MEDLTMPQERDFGWKLKPLESTKFDIHQKENGQFCVVLNHSLIRGVTSKMLHWWFLNFPNLKIKLVDIKGYENKEVPAYLLWHPSDHHSASLSGELGHNNTSKAGAYIQINEAMQYAKYGWKYPVNNKLRIFYCEDDGWAMGKEIPFFGKVMCLRIHFKDIYEDDKIIGVHYHYEIVIGVSGNNLISRFINSKIKSHFSPEFFQAWHTHNTIEVGVFENFLPALYEQRNSSDGIYYDKSMNCAKSFSKSEQSFNKSLFEQRMKGYENTNNPHSYQRFDKKAFI